jgi:hypothetical protein
MIRLHAHPLSPSPVKKLSLFLSLPAVSPVELTDGKGYRVKVIELKQISRTVEKCGLLETIYSTIFSTTLYSSPLTYINVIEIYPKIDLCYNDYSLGKFPNM